MVILDSRVLWKTVSNATVRSSASHAVISGSFLLLNSVTMSVVSCGSVVPGQTPCWPVGASRWTLTLGKMMASKILVSE